MGALTFTGVTNPYGMVTGIDFHGGLGVTSCQTGSVLRTTNGGGTWQKITLPAALRVAMFDVDVIDSQHVVIVGSGHIGYSDDGGAT